MNTSAHIGPFALADRIGEGGMGTIYRGVHRNTGVSVAVKVIRHGTTDAATRRFHREIQAHAELQHPNVVYLFEYGEIPPETADRVDDDLRAGEPFVAMEFARRGTVRDRMPLDDWPTLRRLLVQILDALAYSHARGVVHRDLKPENFLVFDGDAPSNDVGRVKLADFGIAHALDRERETDLEQLRTASGTPHYMAPEQCRGKWRTYGPWTDLYALGCIAWEFACGHPPFTGNNAVELAARHDSAPRPPLDPRFAVPPEFEDWVHRAMAPDPSDRFARAADAAFALPQPDVSADGRSDAPESGDRDPADAPTSATLPAWRPTRDETDPATTDRDLALAETAARSDAPDSDDRGGSPESPASSGPPRPSDAVPPVPEDWRTDRTATLPAPLVGTGLGLFGLRDAPFVDRDSERERIWHALRDVGRRQHSRTVLVSGEPGTGKSRLAEWIATRAHEVGAARVVRAVHTDAGGRNEGMAGALERHLRCVKLSRGDLYEHLLERLQPLDDENGGSPERDARALTEYLRPTGQGADEVDGPRFQFANPGQKHALLARVLRRLARTRPLLLWADDLQWGPDTLDLLEHLEQSQGPAPRRLVVATIRSDVVADQPDLRRRLDDLRTDTSATSLPLEPLDPEHQRELLLRMLPLEDDIADWLTTRTEGHPLFAMQLLGHWIDEGALEVGPDGFRAAPGRELEIPDDVSELWNRRLDRLTAAVDPARSDRVRRAIVRTALLGREVDPAEWRAVCDALSLDDPARIRDELVARGLAERADHGWSFAHGLFVTSLKRRLRETGRWTDEHRRCAELLEELYPDRPRETAPRRAHHWVQTDEPERALEPLAQMGHRAWSNGRPQRNRDAFERRARLIERLDLPDDDPRAIKNDIELPNARLAVGEMPVEELNDRIERARKRAARLGDDRLLSLAWRRLSEGHRKQGAWDDARTSAREAVEHARACGDTELLGPALEAHGWAAYFSGDLDESERLLSDAREAALEVGNPDRLLRSQRALATIELRRGDRERAHRLLEQTLETSRENGFRVVEMNCLSSLGEIARIREQWPTARERFRQSERVARESYLPEMVANARLNLALVALAERQFDAARSWLRAANEAYDRLERDSDVVESFERIVRLTLRAGDGTLDELDAAVADYAADWPDDTTVNDDFAWLLELAGDFAADRDAPDRADRIWQLARDHWTRLGNDTAHDRVTQKMTDPASP